MRMGTFRYAVFMIVDGYRERIYGAARKEDAINFAKTRSGCKWTHTWHADGRKLHVYDNLTRETIF